MDCHWMTWKWVLTKKYHFYTQYSVPFRCVHDSECFQCYGRQALCRQLHEKIDIVDEERYDCEYKVGKHNKDVSLTQERRGLCLLEAHDLPKRLSLNCLRSTSWSWKCRIWEASSKSRLWGRWGCLQTRWWEPCWAPNTRAPWTSELTSSLWRRRTSNRTR